MDYSLLNDLREDRVLNSPCVICNERNQPIRNRHKNHIKQKLLDLEELKESIEELEDHLSKVLSSHDYGKGEEYLEKRKIELLEEKIQERMKIRDQEALKISSQSSQIEKLRKDLDQLSERRDMLEDSYRIRRSINDQLHREMHLLVHQADSARWSSALELFVMMRIDVDDDMIHEHEKTTQMSKKSQSNVSSIKLTGCSSILGIPLTNDGNYENISIEIVTSALSHTSHLVDSVAAVLNIPLPHTIKPFETFREACITPQGVFTENQSSILYPLTQAHRTDSEPLGTVCFDSLSTISKQGELKTGYEVNSIESTKPKISGNNHSWSIRNYFVSAFVLLRANIVALCLRAGLQSHLLFPSNAILLNLHLLHKFCIKKVKISSSFHPYVDPDLMLDVNSELCTKHLSDRYKSKRWLSIDSCKDDFHDFSPFHEAYPVDDAKIVSCEADWAVVDLDKPTIT